MKFDQKAFNESVQEVFRVAAFAAFSAVVSYLLNRFSGMPQTEVVVIGTILLRLVDKYIHESKFTKLNGLTDTKIITKMFKK